MTNFQPDIENCLQVLHQGGLILYPTDTVWGIGCDATNEQAVERIYALKQRPPRKSMIVLLADERDVLQYVANPDLRVFDYLQSAQKPTTVVYEGAIGLASNLIAEDGTIAIRLVQEPFCRHLLKRFRKPLVSTSANISGQPAPATFSEINEHLVTMIDYTVHYRRDDNTPGQPSSVIKWNKNGTPTVIRP